MLAGISLDKALAALRTRGRTVFGAGLAIGTAYLLWDAVTLVRLHPYEYLVYNSLVGGLDWASRRYDLDYWFSSMPEAINYPEAYLRRRAGQRKLVDAHLVGRRPANASRSRRLSR